MCDCVVKGVDISVRLCHNVFEVRKRNEGNTMNTGAYGTKAFPLFRVVIGRGDLVRAVHVSANDCQDACDTVQTMLDRDIYRGDSEWNRSTAPVDVAGASKA